MPVFIHLASEKNLKSILGNGIKAAEMDDEIGKGVYCMPVTQNFVISHQWLRELKRYGHKSIIAVYFKLNDDELVWFGHYNKSHAKITAAEAVKAIVDSEDGQGFEAILPRAITPKEIHRIKHMKQVVGWRYYPEAHGRELCVCPACVRKGTYRSTKKREGRYKELISKLRSEKEISGILSVLGDVENVAADLPSRPEIISQLDFLLEHPSEIIRAELARILGWFNGGRAVLSLSRLIMDKDDEVRRASAEAIMRIKHIKGFEYLEAYKGDKVVDDIIDDYKAWYNGQD
jgi:hypothetical protein